MDFAVNLPTSGGGSADSEYAMLPRSEDIGWDVQRTFATRMEALGFDGLAVPDHLMTGSNHATTECLTTLAGLAAETDDPYLFPKTVNNELRHGPMLAKTLATIDEMSGGRLKVGMGAGWKRDEAVAYGYDWPDAPDRLRAMEETIELCKRLWSGDKVDYDGDYYELDEAVCRPTPVQEPHPPIAIGGGGEEFTLRITAKHADEWNYWGSTELIERKLDVLRDHCETYDSDPDNINVSWFTRCIVRKTDEAVRALLDEAPRFKPKNLDDDENHLVGTPSDVAAELDEYEELGVDEVVVEFVDFPDTTGAELFVDDVVPEFSSGR